MSNRRYVTPSTGPIVRSGILRKLKSQSKKWFVLRGDTPGHPPCLEYYDSKKKFENRQLPKKKISLRSCFNINRGVGTRKYPYVIALYTMDECFSIITTNETELKEWLNDMLLLSGDVPDGEQPRPTFEHVWQVTVERRGLGAQQNILGPYRLCLTDRVLSLVKVGAKEDCDIIEYPLVCIRRCGCGGKIFFMEVGRSTITGDGDFWMQAEDIYIAQNMHRAILDAMTNIRERANSASNGSVAGSTCVNASKDDVGPRQRVRSSSANEASKPISVLPQRHTGAKHHGFSPLEEQSSIKEQVDPLRDQHCVTASVPPQCSQSQSTSSSNTLTAAVGTGNFGINFVVNNNNNNNPNNNINNNNIVISSSATANRRRHSVASHPHSANNPQSSIPTTTSTTTTASSTTTTTTTAAATTIATKSHQRTLSLPLAAVVVNQTQSSKRSVLRCATGRDRCDSLPSRARTTSEGYPLPIIPGHPRSVLLAPHIPRPHSMYGRGLSYSPPVTSMPISPASGACSTDSAGSSLSMDDGADNILEEGTACSRYGHSLTPDEPVILEENMDDYAPWSGEHQPQKSSPNFISNSPSQQNSYVEMCSPCGSSPGRGGSMSAAYMPMSPATSGVIQQQHSHSRASSLIEETTLPDGYVPMAPVGDDGYVDMDPSNSSHQNGHHFPDDMSQHEGSTCSVTSGTPSTDLRFSEYHLDKVTSFLVPGEENPARPTRAYSVGSRPEPASRHRKNRLDIAQQESSRVRAFSVGSRSKRPEIVGRLVNVIAARLPTGSTDCSTSSKSNSAPLLSSSWGHNSGCSVTSERMEDLMELDFTRPNVVQETMNSPPTSSYSHSQSYSTATDTSSYVDMSPGQPHPLTASTATITTAATITAPYVDMSGTNKNNRNNNNNNNNTTTANHNHNQAATSVSPLAHKPVIKTLKPVEETDGAYMRMGSSIEEWSRAGTSPKQAPSPMQDDYMQMNGPPGVTRTAPVDLPQPRRPPEGYVEMSFKLRPSLEQDYINMSTQSVPTSGVSSSRPRTRRARAGSCTEKSQRSKPIAIKITGKNTKIPSFLPLNGSPTSESRASTPASPPRATPTGSNVTIFPFSLNSPQSPIKPFTISMSKPDENHEVHSADYAIMSPGIGSSSTSTMSLQNPISHLPEVTKSLPNSAKAHHELPQSPLTKRLNELTLSRTKMSRNSVIPEQSAVEKIPTGIEQVARSSQPEVTPQSPVTTRRATETTFSKMKTSRGNFAKDDTTVPTSLAKTIVSEVPTSDQNFQESPTSPLTKRLCDLSVVKSKLVQPSPNTSPTPSAGFKIVQGPKTPTNGKMADDSSGGTTPIATPTPTATPSPLDSEGYEKLQPGATILHYASLDLPEAVGAPPPVSPTTVIEGSSYAEIDFGKLKQN